MGNCGELRENKGEREKVDLFLFVGSETLDLNLLNLFFFFLSSNIFLSTPNSRKVLRDPARRARRATAARVLPSDDGHGRGVPRLVPQGHGTARAGRASEERGATEEEQGRRQRRHRCSIGSRERVSLLLLFFS